MVLASLSKTLNKLRLIDAIFVVFRDFMIIIQILAFNIQVTIPLRIVQELL